MSGTAIEREPSEAELRELILRALSDQRFKFRAIDGIATDANVSRQMVWEALRSDAQLGHLVKIFPVRANDGRPLFTTKDRFVKEATFTEKFIDFFGSERVSIGY